MEEAPNKPLHFIIAEGFGLTDQQCQFPWQFTPFFYRPSEYIREVIQMDRSLTSADVTWIDMAEQLTLLDAGDLLRQERRMTTVIIDSSQPEQSNGNLAVFLANESFSLDL